MASRAFVFSDWPLKGMSEHTINISYYPTNLTVEPTEYNSGISTLILLESNNKTSTPGFEFIAIFGVLFIVFLIKKYRRS